MTFLSLLTKEMRLRLRRERTIWVIISYVFLMGLLGWIFLSKVDTSNSGLYGNQLSNVGATLYALLAQIQLLLIIFITPSFTATAINSEKERQTYEMLLCSRLSAFSLIMGKLGAGLLNALLLIAASIPLFSLVFFFGGVSPTQVANVLLIFLVTALWLATMGIFCSIIIARPAISTAIAYVISLLWVFFPLLLSSILMNAGNGYRLFQLYPNRTRFLYLWSPLMAINDTSPNNNILTPFLFYLNPGFAMSYTNSSNTPLFTVGGWHLSYWSSYLLISVGIALLFLILSIWLVKPHRYLFTRHRLATRAKKSPITA